MNKTIVGLGLVAVLALAGCSNPRNETVTYTVTGKSEEVTVINKYGSTDYHVFVVGQPDPLVVPESIYAQIDKGKTYTFRTDNYGSVVSADEVVKP